MENFLWELEDYKEMIEEDIQLLKNDCRSIYPKDFVLRILSNYLQDITETINNYKETH